MSHLIHADNLIFRNVAETETNIYNEKQSRDIVFKSNVELDTGNQLKFDTHHIYTNGTDLEFRSSDGTLLMKLSP